MQILGWAHLRGGEHAIITTSRRGYKSLVSVSKMHSALSLWNMTHVICLATVLLVTQDTGVLKYFRWLFLALSTLPFSLPVS